MEKLIYGGLTLDVVSMSSNMGRQTIVHRPAWGDGATVQDRGRLERRDTFAVIFGQRTGADRPRERRAQFVELLKQPGESRLLVHPTDGEWWAKIGEVSSSLDADSADTYSVEFIEDMQPRSVQSGGLGGVVSKGIAAVRDAVRALVSAMPAGAESGSLAPSLADDTLELAEGWDSAPVGGSGSIDPQLDAYSARIDRVMAEERNLNTLVALHELRRQVRLYAELVKAGRGVTRTYRVERTMPLICLCVQLFGDERARDQYGAIMAMNRLDRPYAIEAGALLRIPVR